jgi:hypothetical protein
MSGLEKLLKTVSRPQVSEVVLSQCLEADRVVVENILTVVQDVITFVDISSCSIEVKNNQYRISIPLCKNSAVSLQDFRTIESYSPARISSISLVSCDASLYIQIKIVDESFSMSCTQVDLIRVTKKQRFF